MPNALLSNLLKIKLCNSSLAIKTSGPVPLTVTVTVSTASVDQGTIMEQNL